MATFSTLVKIYSTKYFCNIKVAELGEIFVQRKVLVIRYVHYAYNKSAVVSPVYLRHVGPASLQHWFFFDVGKERGQKL